MSGGKNLIMDPNFALQDRFLEVFFNSTYREKFYLTGGTALARFYFNHRESLDLDLFTNDQNIDFYHVNQLVLSIFYTLDLKISSQANTDTFIQSVVLDQDGSSLKVDIVKDIPIHFGENLLRDGIWVDSLENIGSNKILAVFGRTDAKDFIDLYWILHHTDLRFGDLFELAQSKDAGLNELYLAYALQNIDKISLFPKMLKPFDWGDIQVFFQELSRQLLSQIKPG